jgi:hypothetical protein
VRGDSPANQGTGDVIIAANGVVEDDTIRPTRFPATAMTIDGMPMNPDAIDVAEPTS